MIRKITEETKTTIDIQDDGTVNIGSTNAENTQRAVDMIRGLTREVEPGEIYTGKVTRIMPFGAFVEMLPGKEGLVHISELANYRVPTVEDVVNIGDEIQVLVTEIDRQGRINLSRRALLEPENGQAEGEASAEGETDGGPGETPTGDQPLRRRPFDERRGRNGGGYRDRDRGSSDRPRSGDRRPRPASTGQRGSSSGRRASMQRERRRPRVARSARQWGLGTA